MVTAVASEGCTIWNECLTQKLSSKGLTIFMLNVFLLTCGPLLLSDCIEKTGPEYYLSTTLLAFGSWAEMVH